MNVKNLYQKVSFFLRRKDLFVNLFLLGLGIIVSLILAEILLRTFQFLGEKNTFGLKPLFTTLVWENDQDIGKVLLKPNSSGWFVTPSKEYFSYIESNNEGFYDTNHSAQKKASTIRIVLLGDSFVQSFQSTKNETVGKKLERKLNQTLKGYNFEVISLGMGDTGTAQQLIALKKYGLKYQPDLIIHMFLTANDVKNNSFSLQKDPLRPYFVLGHGKLRLVPKKNEVKSLNTTIKNTLKKAILISQALQLKQTFSKQNQVPTDYKIYYKNLDQEFSEAWSITKELLIKTKNTANKNSSKYLLITLANNEQVNVGTVWNEILKTYPDLKKDDLDIEAPDDRLQIFCQEANLDCLFLLPEFQKFKSNNPLIQTHYKYDGHWTSAGIELASEVIANHIKTNSYFSIK